MCPPRDFTEEANARSPQIQIVTRGRPIENDLLVMRFLVIVRGQLKVKLLYLRRKLEVGTLRYFFHFVSNGSMYEDPKGEHFSSIEEALDNARVMAAMLNLDGLHNRTQMILVTDQAGAELARVDIGDQRSAGWEGD
jgi:hypothetical protein